MSSTAQLVVDELVTVGFEEVPMPLRVAGAEFEFERALLGTGIFHDLVVIGTGAISDQRLARLTEGLSRALDHAESTRPVTLVHVGEAPSLSDQDRLERNVRLLLVQDTNAGRDQVRRDIAVLMPLVLPSDHQANKEPLAEVIKALGSAASEEYLHFVGVAAAGEHAVRDALRSFIDEAFHGDADELMTP